MPVKCYPKYILNRTEALEKYGKRQAKFLAYNRHRFIFVDGDLTVSVGTDVDSILYFSVVAGTLYTVSDLMRVGWTVIWDNFLRVYKDERFRIITGPVHLLTPAP